MQIKSSISHVSRLPNLKTHLARFHVKLNAFSQCNKDNIIDHTINTLPDYVQAMSSIEIFHNIIFSPHGVYPKRIKLQAQIQQIRKAIKYGNLCDDDADIDELYRALARTKRELVDVINDPLTNDICKDYCSDAECKEYDV